MCILSFAILFQISLQLFLFTGSEKILICIDHVVIKYDRNFMLPTYYRIWSYKPFDNWFCDLLRVLSYN